MKNGKKIQMMLLVVVLLIGGICAFKYFTSQPLQNEEDIAEPAENEHEQQSGKESEDPEDETQEDGSKQSDKSSEHDQDTKKQDGADQKENTTKEEETSTEEQIQPPTLVLKWNEKHIVQTYQYDYLECVESATDYKGKDLANKEHIKINYFPSETVGTYNVTFALQDDYGQYDQDTITIYVEPDESFDWEAENGEDMEKALEEAMKAQQEMKGGNE